MSTRHLIDDTEFDPKARVGRTRKIERAAVRRADLGSVTTEVVEQEPYLFTDDLTEVVRLALALGRPLLLQGDPGSGKTRLAYAVAYRLGLPIEECYVKSTTRARDLLYSYDALTRLYDSEVGVAEDSPRRPDDIGSYIEYGPFGRAIARAALGRRSVVLIDEVDKADIDFPNDLLREIDRLEFEVTETGERIRVPADRPDLRPIIFVTHNEEKPLPPAFLRRCIYWEMAFPTDTRLLEKVLRAHGVDDVPLAKGAVDALLRIRSKELTRKPGLAELLDWARILDRDGIGPDQLAEAPALPALVKQPLDQEKARLALAET